MWGSPFIEGKISKECISNPIYPLPKVIDLCASGSERGKANKMFGVLPGDREAAGKLDQDGFPPIGTLLQEGDPFYRYLMSQLIIGGCSVCYEFFCFALV